MKLADFRIGTLGSHSALQILKGARDEGFKNLVVCERGQAQPYRAFQVADEIIEVDSYDDIAGLDALLIKKHAIMIPHGSFFRAFGLYNLSTMSFGYFGNKKILPWEENRKKQREWLKKANLTLPKIY